MVFGSCIELVHWIYGPTYNWGHHLADLKRCETEITHVGSFGHAWYNKQQRNNLPLYFSWLFFFGCGHGELWVESAYHSGHVFAAGLGLLGDDRQDQEKQNIAFKFKCVVPSPFLKMPLFHNSFHISCNRCIFWTCSIHLPDGHLNSPGPQFFAQEKKKQKAKVPGLLLFHPCWHHSLQWIAWGL